MADTTILNCPCCAPIGGGSGYRGSGGSGGAGFGVIIPGMCTGCFGLPIVYKLTVSGIVNSSYGGNPCTHCPDLNGTFLLYYRGLRPSAFNPLLMIPWWATNEQTDFSNCAPGIGSHPRWELECGWFLLAVYCATAAGGDPLCPGASPGGFVGFVWDPCGDITMDPLAWQSLGTNPFTIANITNGALQFNACDWTNITGTVTAIP